MALTLSGPVKGYLPVIAALMLANTVFGSVSLMAVLPLLEAVSAGALGKVGAAGLDLAGTSRVTQLTLEFFAWAGVTQLLTGLAVLLIVLFFIKALVAFFSIVVSYAVAQAIRRVWMMRLTDYYMLAPYREISGMNLGVIVNNLKREPKLAAAFIQSYIQQLMLYCMTAALILALLVVDWMLVVAGVAVMLAIYLLAGRPLFGYSSRLGKRNVALSQQNQGVVQETAASIKELRIGNCEKYQSKKMLKSIIDLNRNQLWFRSIEAVPSTFGQFIPVLLAGAVLIWVEQAYSGDVSTFIAQFVFMMIGFSRIFDLFMQIAAKRVVLSNKYHSARLVLDLDRKISRQLGGDPWRDRGGKPVERLLTDIVLEHVSFSHVGRAAVLDDVSLTLARGGTHFLVGRSGSGKSTIIDLLVRLYDPESGRILCNGEDVRDFSIAAWRARIGYSGQSSVLFAQSLRENIRLGRPADDAWLDQVVEATGLAEQVAKLSQGLDTVLDGAGFGLSEGQRKRIAIARAVFRRPDLIIIDEAMTAIEERLEHQILSNIRRLLPEATLIIITHRISTIGPDDHVILLDSGRIAADARFAEIEAQVRERLTHPVREIDAAAQ